MKKILEELQIAKQKKEEFQKSEQDKKDFVNKKVKDMKSLMDEICNDLTTKLNEQVAGLEIKVHAPFDKIYTTTKYGDPPTKEWKIEATGFSNGEIIAFMNEDFSIQLSAAWYSRFHIYCFYKDGEWSFSKVPYGLKDRCYTEFTEQTETVNEMSEIAEILLSDVIAGMGDRASKKC